MPAPIFSVAASRIAPVADDAIQRRLMVGMFDAARLVFKHPSEHRRMEFNSPLPADLERVLADLRDSELGRE